MAQVNADLSAVFTAAKIPASGAAALTKALFASQSQYAAIPDTGRELHARSEAYQLEQVIPGGTAKAEATIAKMRAAQPELVAKLEAGGAFKSRHVLAALARLP